MLIFSILNVYAQYLFLSPEKIQIIRRLDKVNDPSKTIFIACEEDMEEALAAVKKGAWTFSSDWFMNCIMRQKLDLEEPQFAESL